ncbi:MAG: CotH kinase family protein [Planctomycetaceae bacterium]
MRRPTGRMKARWGSRIASPQLTAATRALLLICLLNFLGCQSPAESTPPRPKLTGTTVAPPPVSAIEIHPGRDASDDFFEADTVYRITLRFTETQLERLRTEPRSYARGTLTVEGEAPLTDVAVKLKGAAGSYQELDGKPAFTLNVGKFLKGQEFHRLRKFHLNNSVQDESYTSEWLCASICRDLGLPAPRVAHARVWLNDRDLGMYVLKEGFDRNFLKRNFVHPGGNLYDGGFCQEIDAELERDEGRGPDDRADLRGLVAACQEPDPVLSAERLAGTLDLPAFYQFMAFELLIAHWDGYCGNRNNYRIYFDPPSGKAYFLPHGMDQTFGDPEFPLFANLGGLVTEAVWARDEAGRKAYREVVRRMLARLDVQDLVARVNRLQQRLQPALAEIDSELGRRTAEWREDWSNRLEARWASATRQLTEPDRLEPPAPPEPEIESPDVSRPVLLAGWFPQKETEDAAHGEEPGDPLAPWNRPPAGESTGQEGAPDAASQTATPEEANAVPEDMPSDPSPQDSPTESAAVPPAEPPTETEPESPPESPPEAEPVPVVLCTVTVGDSGDCVASWRKRVRLPAGRYRVTLWARVEGVVPREGDERGPGAGLRLSGQNRESGLVSTTDWTELACEFDMSEEQPEVELVAELRATAGQAWFRTPARLERLAPPPE